MSFNSGIYAIKNKKTGLFVGRNWQNEDRSLNPKPIISVPKGADIPNWLIEKDDELILIKSIGAPTAIIKKNIYAILLPEPEPQQWVFVPAGGERLYSIRQRYGRLGWFVDTLGNPNLPVGAREVGANGHPDEEVFEMIRVADV